MHRILGLLNAGMIVRYVSAITVVVAGLGGVVLGAAQPASAKPYCASQLYCIYEDAGWGGKDCQWIDSNSNYNSAAGACYDAEGSYRGTSNDIASGWINSGTGTYQYIHSYEHANYSGQLWVSLGYNQSDCDWVGSGQCGGTGANADDNDKASSHSWGSS